jgi:ribosomal protein L37E
MNIGVGTNKNGGRKIERIVDMRFSYCGRCGTHSYEQLTTYGYCVNCNYSAELEFEDKSASTLAWACKLVDEEEKKENLKIVPFPTPRKMNPSKDIQNVENQGVL